MRARLYSPAANLPVDHTFEKEAVIGRSSRSTLELASRVLSTRHARIAWSWDRSCYMLEDLGSSNGTRLDGEAVTEPRALGHLHVITLAEHHDLVFQDLERCAARHSRARESTDPTTRTSIEVLNLPLPGLTRSDPGQVREKTLLQKLELPLPGFLRGRAGSGDEGRPDDEASSGASARATPRPGVDTEPSPPVHREAPTVRVEDAVDAPVPAAPRPVAGTPARELPARDSSAAIRQARWSIEVLDPSIGAPRYRLHGGDNVVGRKTGADIVIRSPEISRRHACLAVRDGRLWVRDLGSRNQTFVDDVVVEGEVQLSPGQMLRFGALETRVTIGGFSDEGQPLDPGGSGAPRQGDPQ